MKLDKKLVKIGHLIDQAEYNFFSGRKNEAFSLLEFIQSNFKLDRNNYYSIKLKLKKCLMYLHEYKMFDAEILLTHLKVICKDENLIEESIITSCLFSQIISYNGQNFEALELIREAVEKAQVFFLPRLSNCYYQLTRIHLELGELKISLNYCNLAIELLKKYPLSIENIEEKILLWKLYNLKGVILTNIQGEDINNILTYFSQAKTIALNHFLVEALPEIYINIASTHLNFGNFKSARYYLENCILVSEEIENYKVLSDAYEYLAEIYGAQGDYKHSHNYFEKAIAFRLSLKLSMWSVYNKLAILERYYGHYEEAISNHEEALNNLDVYQEHRQKALVLSQYSITLLRINRVEKSKELINEAKKTLELQKRNLPPEIYISEGLYYLIKDGASTGLKYFMKAYSLAEENFQSLQIVESSLYIINCLLSIYNERFQIKYYLNAQKYINEAFEIATKSNLYPQIININFLKGGFHAAEYNYGEALKTIASAVNKANELGFENESKDGRNFIQQINLALNRVGRLSNIVEYTNILTPSIYQTGAVLSYVNKLINIQDKEIDYFDFVLTCFKFTKIGPEPFFMSPSIDEFKKFKNSGLGFILNLGVLLSYLLGQGQEYFEGMYSIPVQGFKLLSSALVYSAKVQDSEVDDERLKGENFVIFCFIYPEKFEQETISRSDIKELFVNYININKNLATWQREDLQNLRVSIIEYMIRRI